MNASDKCVCVHMNSDFDTQDPPAEVVALLKWTLQNVQTYFKGITGRRWIPRPQALLLAQACHDFTDSQKQSMHVCLTCLIDSD